MPGQEEALREERRAKMLALKKSLDPSFRDDGVRTSAPSVRQVDQFQEQYGVADQREQARRAQFSPEDPSSIEQRRRRQQVSFSAGTFPVSFQTTITLQSIIILPDNFTMSPSS